MSQSFTPNYPPTNGAAVSATERANWAALLSNNAGASLPTYGVEGTTWYDTGSRQLHVLKPYGSKAFGQWAMGATINLAAALTGSGQDGSTYSVLVRVRTNAIMSGADRSWTLIGSALDLDFNVTYPPAYFAGRTWADANIGEPVLWTADGKLIGKGWDSIPVGHDDNVYTGSPAVLDNVVPFLPTTLRAVNVEEHQVVLDASTPPSSVLDHVVLALPIAWWEVQDGKLDFDLVESGVHRPAATFKAVPFMWSGSPYIVVYNRGADGQTLLPFDPSRPRRLTVTKKV